MIHNGRLLKALACEPVDCTPVWIMRQAGRYLPEYRATRARAGSFLQLCQTPEFACEVTLQPVQRFALDAAILFSDILTIPQAMGLELEFIEHEGPHFPKPLSCAADIHNLKIPEPQHDLTYVLDAVKLIKHELANRIPLIGFCGSPWTLACYMIEGSGSKNFHKIKSLLFTHPTLIQQLLEKLTLAVAKHLSAQISAGVDVVMLFDSWGGILTTGDYLNYSLKYIQQIIEILHAQHPHIPSIIFTKHGSQWLEFMANSGCSAISLDWNINITEAKQRVGGKVALQGNLDPAILLSTPERIRQEVQTILTQYGGDPGHIFNLGHGITPDVPAENVAVLVDAVHEFSASPTLKS